MCVCGYGFACACTSYIVRVVVDGAILLLLLLDLIMEGKENNKRGE